MHGVLFIRRASPKLMMGSDVYAELLIVPYVMAKELSGRLKLTGIFNSWVQAIFDAGSVTVLCTLSLSG